ncbi:hypothetical protein P3S68_002867 [Capsicum galapagoense]
MGREIIKSIWIMLIMLSLLLGDNNNYVTKGEPQVPCYFIFGDSLVDNGNNNVIRSLARADYLPYGIDFPDGPTGRFSNGKTTVDVIAELLGFDDYSPPYATARGRQILRGVNLASAAAGIREETGQQLVLILYFIFIIITFALFYVIVFDRLRQVNNFKNIVQQIVRIIGDENSAANYLSKCIYSIGDGSNDYPNNYFMPLYYLTSRQYTPQQYANVLIQQYTQQLKGHCNLYNYGARKFVPDDLIDNPFAFGFRVTNAECCGVGRNNGQITCLPFQNPCPNRNEYLFWDAFHAGEAANIIVRRRSYRAQKPSDAYPFDIQHLTQLGSSHSVNVVIISLLSTFDVPITENIQKGALE